VEEKYEKITGVKSFDPDAMRQFVLSKIARKHKGDTFNLIRPYWDSERTSDGFILQNKDRKHIAVTLGMLAGDLPEEAAIHNEVYSKNKNINFIIHSDAPDVTALSRAGITLYPLVDDFAQIIGTKVKTVLKNPVGIASALRSSSAVFIENNGALCCGSTEGDAQAVHMILKKNSKACISGTLFGDVLPLSRFDSKLMRFVYLKKYSKQISANK